MPRSAARWGWVLITGASSGIGLELSKQFAKDGHSLILVARNANRLEEETSALRQEYGVQVKFIPTDLADPMGPRTLVEELKRQNLPIQVLVNNAGFGTFGPFSEIATERTMDMIQVNLTSLTLLTRLLVGEMIQRGSGKIVNVASTASFQPGPLMAVYYATKAYVLSFSEAIANELEKSGVTVTAVCPGPTTSGFQKAAKMEMSKLVQGAIMDSKSVAEIAYRGILRGKRIVITGFKNRALAQSIRFAPRGLVLRVVRRMQEAR